MLPVNIEAGVNAKPSIADRDHRAKVMLTNILHLVCSRLDITLRDVTDSVRAIMSAMILVFVITGLIASLVMMIGVKRGEALTQPQPVGEVALNLPPSAEHGPIHRYSNALCR
jgi:hypothetical protein